MEMHVDNFLRRLYIVMLFVVCLFTTAVLLYRNGSYYVLPETERPYHQKYEQLKPSGIESHAFGIFGSVLIISGVALYSTRKRIRRFSDVGRIKNFLEVHIFLCLFGPTLILFHTTFKFGGLVGVSFWSMSAVVLSGIVGRFLYVQIPKGITGNELTAAELDVENQRLYDMLHVEHGLDDETIQRIDALALPLKPVADLGFMEAMSVFVFQNRGRRRQLRALFRNTHAAAEGQKVMRDVYKIANQRMTLMSRIAFLEQLKRVFHYWHVIHLPFTAILFIILVIHVAVAITFGYTWIW
jgi:hypothetical protein